MKWCQKWGSNPRPRWRTATDLFNTTPEANDSREEDTRTSHDHRDHGRFSYRRNLPEFKSRNSDTFEKKRYRSRSDKEKSQKEGTERYNRQGKIANLDESVFILELHREPIESCPDRNFIHVFKTNFKLFNPWFHEKACPPHKPWTRSEGIIPGRRAIESNVKETMRKKLYLRKMASWVVSFGIIVALFLASANAQLSATYYDKLCPNALSIIKSEIKKVLSNEPRMGASILRLHFHDCFAQSQLEATCSGVVSCADILIVAARDSVVQLGGPTWTVPLGRRDSTTSNKIDANANIPSPTSTLSNLSSLFQAQGLSTKDMVALSGAHTIGQARCTVIRNRIYNDTDIDSTYVKSPQSNCPSDKSGNRNLSPLEDVSPTVFDNNYYKELTKKKGLLHSDQELFNGGSTDSLVTTYSNDENTFFKDFAAAMVKMGNISPLTGSNGEIRKNCRKAN
ncbi:hypothetical protein KI387_023102 [Taxus chinensis]|uniref:Plant heme peroxidase family profile domain-containing protein n=1 Tax=Taxus chinensis TaxID=29808 RepID=A0AA38G245_TAXCH|nr:hypothetical protein KI387_023102 [Taxus chinensis]